MIIDAHIHLWKRLHGNDSGIERRPLGWGKAREGECVYYATPPAFEDSLSTYERSLAHMDWLGVDRAVVLQEFMDGKQDVSNKQQLEFITIECDLMSEEDRATILGGTASRVYQWDAQD